jgi:hypothetical protein
MAPVAAGRDKESVDARDHRVNIGEGLALRTTGAYVDGSVSALKPSATVRIANREVHTGDTLIQPIDGPIQLVSAYSFHG